MAKKHISIGEQVREARKAAELSQEALAAKIGITRGHLAKVESGFRDADRVLTLPLALALAVMLPSLDWFSKGLSAQLDARRKELQLTARKASRAKKPA